VFITALRAIGQAEVALEKTCRRLNTRVAFGKALAEQSAMLERVAEARTAIDQTRLLVLKAADVMDKLGNEAALAEIAIIKVAAAARLCHPGVRRRRRHRRLRPRRGLRVGPGAAHCRWPG
jgi:alkylation response protein AidB-like acyl-CoA dehydrogenase